MSLRIDNEPRTYEWGELGGIARIRGAAAEAFHTATPAADGTYPVVDADLPQAELWLGTHPAWPAIVTEGPRRGESLPQALKAEGGSGDAGFLLKLLAIAQPLSVQVHPNDQEAAVGFERENALGIPLDSPDRNYRDPNAKPEMVYVLSPEFELCAGFRPIDETLIDVRRALRTETAPHQLIWQQFVDVLDGEATYERALAWLLRDDSANAITLAQRIARASATGRALFGVERDTLNATLQQFHPDDIGIPFSLLLRHEKLRRGQALYLEPGTPHFYILGSAIELMGPSDNVIRAGLTHKHVDVAELLRVIDVEPRAPRHLFEYHKGSMTVFHAAGAGLRLAFAHGNDGRLVDVDYHPGDIAYVLSGALEVHGADGAVQQITDGQAILLSNATSVLYRAPASGHGSVVVAGTTPRE